MIDTPTNPAKIHRQGPNCTTPCPIAGARIGMTMNTIMTKDITRAMPRPAKRSRTMAMAMIRGAAAPKP